ncbi:MAG: hypothetical protein Q4A58_04680 [Fusobacterium sp.]|uniref:hypothetical protein n=1 Tax=Fusobacterium sp. TaxID=68766 RepID=UPI0026DC96F3|nr:hypothetical protein [Fusobacterium sp.]MDO4690571.1 hypothetical protein [Fusobacterium sp.]
MEELVTNKQKAIIFVYSLIILVSFLAGIVIIIYSSFLDYKYYKKYSKEREKMNLKTNIIKLLKISLVVFLIIYSVLITILWYGNNKMMANLLESEKISIEDLKI